MAFQAVLAGAKRKEVNAALWGLVNMWMDQGEMAFQAVIASAKREAVGAVS